ncbi:MAG: hypothetical protein IKN17_00910 [Ruminococcus sp.]|nr:hypothetical protein [Ruminococcus sp.]
MYDYYDDMDKSPEETDEAYKVEHTKLLSCFDEHGELISSGDEEKDRAVLHKMRYLKRHNDYDG